LKAGKLRQDLEDVMAKKTLKKGKKLKGTKTLMKWAQKV
jgi:hypothetical protein